MTATDTRIPPALPSGIFRTLAYDAVIRVAERENDELITEAQANADLDFYLSYRRDLTRDDRDAAYEQLREALKRLAYIRGDMFDPADGDRDYLEALADGDMHNAVIKLIGSRK